MSSPEGLQLSSGDLESGGRGASVVPGSGIRTGGTCWGRARASAPSAAGPLWRPFLPTEDSDPAGTYLLVLSAQSAGWTGPRLPAPPEIGPVPTPWPQGTKADLRAGSVPVTNEPPSRCSLRPELMGGCSPQAEAGRGSRSEGAGSLLAVPGTVLTETAWIVLGEPSLSCHRFS